MAVFIAGLYIPKTMGQLSPICRTFLSVHASPIPAIGSRRSVCSKLLKDPNVTRRPPFPYMEKKYTLLRSWLDRTTHRFDENSKIIVVDGAVGAGKTAFAKQLAEDLDMLYMPEANMDAIYINPYGYDMRQLDPQLPKNIRSIDIKKFLDNPNDINVAYLQVELYRIKFCQYIDALAHLMNTGQGVVMDKSCYSDFVYADALVKEGYITKPARYVYQEVVNHTIDELMRPHLAIYLDMPVTKSLEKIKERGRDYEINSKANSASFLTKLEESYKRNYLKQVSIHSELLIYDWSDGGDVEVVVEDIERIDFDKYTLYDERMKDWRLPKEQAWADQRMKYTNDKHQLMELFNICRLDAPELMASGNDCEVFNQVWWNAPGMKYAEGYNADYGDSNPLMRLKRPKKFSFWE